MSDGGGSGTATKGPDVAPGLVCLLPARNAAALLPAWFDSVAMFADAVVALDDGSEDDTGAVLARHPLVASLTHNPVRPGYAAWDDAANRRTLLAATAELRPRWVMQLDADERIPADDGRALRAFLLGAADPEFAYRFRVYRMVDDVEHYDVDHEQWVCRCFAFDPTHRLPTERLHFVPVPTAFPPERRVRTTFRIQHLAGLTAADRRHQVAKYRDADPRREFQASYEHLLRAPATVRRWAPRSQLLHPIANHPVAPPTSATTTSGPRISVVLAAVDPTDAATLPDRLGAVVEQQCPDPFEVVAVVADADEHTTSICTARPSVVTVAVARGTSRDQALATGIGRSRGSVVVAPSGRPAPGYLAALLRGHGSGFALATGVERPAAVPPAGLAALLLDRPDALVGAPGGPLAAAPRECSFGRDVWDELGADLPVQPDVGRIAVHAFARGYSATRVTDAVIEIASPVTTARGLLRWSFQRGRTRGRVAVAPRQAIGALRRLPSDLRPAPIRAYALLVLAGSAAVVGSGVGWSGRRVARARRAAPRC